MHIYERLILENRAWAEEKALDDPDFFRRTSGDQRPEVLWIGCSDSRVPAELIVNAQPGEIFVHRNIANQMVTTDFNSLSVLQFAVEVLQVKHIIVCGHHGCGGVRAALRSQSHELMFVNHWLKSLRDIHRFNQQELEAFKDEDQRVHRMVELNVVEQIYNIAHTSIVQRAWQTRQSPMLHGWVYAIGDGHIRQMITLPPGSMINDIYR
jgi:carbonic anhydrase